MNREEIWKWIPGYEYQYEVSNYGRVRSLKRGTEKLLGKKSYLETERGGHVVVIPLVLKELFSNDEIHYLKREEDYDLEGEIWKPIREYENYYLISNKGRVKGIPRLANSPSCKRGIKYLPGKVCKLQISNSGYLRVTLHENEKSTKYLVHRIVAKEFLEPVEGKSIVNHIDGNKLNNSLENLEWCTAKENRQHAIKLGLVKNQGEDNSQTTLKTQDVLRMREKWKNKKELKCTRKSLAKEFNITPSSVKAIVTGRTWKHLLNTQNG